MPLIYSISHYFVPGYSNNQKAKLLHPVSVAFMILILIVYQIILQLIPSTGVNILGYAANISTDEVINLTNKKREESGLLALTANPQLTKAAQDKGKDMLEKNYWAHVAPDGTEPWVFFINEGYKYRFAGENLARDFSNASSAIDAWMASPSHRDNLLSSKYSEIGVAVVEGDLNGVETTLIVQLFGARYEEVAPQVPIAKAQDNSPKLVQPTPHPTLVPTVTLIPTEVPIVVAPVAGAGGVSLGGPRVLVSPFTTTKGVSVFTVIMLLSVLAVDGVITSRRKVSRIGGRTFAHLAFLGMVLAIVMIARAGEIL